MRRQHSECSWLDALSSSLAAEGDHPECLRVLVTEGGADVGAGDPPPLFLAAKNGHMECVTILVAELGADPKKANSSGKTPAEVAEEAGHSEVAAFLCRHLSER
eukprot:Hpha_TRINITY_DN12280_c1_g1::TRINITY_DN12280_c1_g1_i1::g.16850::m.16850